MGSARLSPSKRIDLAGPLLLTGFRNAGSTGSSINPELADEQFDPPLPVSIAVSPNLPWRLAPVP